MKNFELIQDNVRHFNGVTLFRIRCIRDFMNVKSGDLGGGGWSVQPISKAMPGSATMPWSAAMPWSATPPWSAAMLWSAGPQRPSRADYLSTVSTCI